MLQQNTLHLYKPNPKQQQFHALGSQAQERLLLAGNRCGKTHGGAMEVAMHLTGQYPSWWAGQRYDRPVQAWAASVTSEATRDILQAAYIGEGEAGQGAIPAYCILRKTLRRGVADALDQIHVRHQSGGVSVLGFKSYDQGREKFQGTARDIIHLDEEPDISIYEECLTRTMTLRGHILLTMTPLKGMTEVCQRFLQSPPADKVVVQASWDDAPHLDPAEIARLQQSLRPYEIEARSKGIPALGRGKVFPVPEDDIFIAPFDIPPHFAKVYGLDFGWSNPTACVWAAHDRDNDIVYIYDCYSASEQPPAVHAAAILARGSGLHGVCDPAGQSSNPMDGQNLMDIYARNGLKLTKADNAVESGLMHMLERMQQGRLKVFNTLESWKHEFRLYQRDEQGRIVKRHDHLLDATRYIMTSGLPLAQTSTPRRTTRHPPDWRTA